MTIAMAPQVRASARKIMADRFDAVHARAALAVAERDGLADAIPALRARRDATDARAGTETGPMLRLARRLDLARDHVDFVWAVAAASAETRVACHVEALGGPATRRGLSVAEYARIADLAEEAARDLALWLARGCVLVREGLLLVDDELATLVARRYRTPARLLAYLVDDATPEPPLRRVAYERESELVFDAAQRAVLEQLARVLAGAPAAIVVEGPRGTGKTTAIARAAQQPLIVLDAERLAATTSREALLALRRETVLGSDIPVIAGIDELTDADRPVLAAILRDTPGPWVLTSATPDFDLGTDRPLVRFRWPVPGCEARRQLWTVLGGHATGDVDALATRFRVGPGVIGRAVASARRLDGGVLDAHRLALGLRHNFTEALRGLARRVDVLQTWDDLVLAPDTMDQIAMLVARVEHAHQVLERWRFHTKLARGTGVAALFSGLPGTGKTMVAGLIANQLGLDLYQVDLSQVVSKWVGETEKQLARVFDVAEQGHALLLFDEADALFGQRTKTTNTAVDRYANLEVNYLLQRVESFGGITILTTNLDQSIDHALKRRLAAHIVFELPDDEERELLWRRAVTTGAAPVARCFDPGALARTFGKMSGANIRNAAIAAAFLAAAGEARAITQDALVRAARAEYRSMGHVLTESVHAGGRR
jgi:AAA+ superfamily predicted ATPase